MLHTPPGPKMSKLSLPTKIAYSVGQTAEGMKNTAFVFILLFYYNQVLGIPGGLCSIALLIAMLVDAVTDPMMGAISDGWHSRWGRRHPFMYGAALPMAACFFLTFNPLVESELALFVWMTVFAVLTRFTATIFVIPHWALGAELTDDYDERSSLVAGRTIFGMTGMLVVLGVGFGWFFASSEEFPDGQLNGSAYAPFAAVLGVVMAVSILATAWGTRHVIPGLPSVDSRKAWRSSDLFLDIVIAARNASFRWLVVGMIILAIPVGVGMSLSVYMNTFFWEVTPSSVGTILGAYTLGSVLGLLAAPRLSRALEKRPSLILGSLGWALFAIAPVCLHYAGLFPAPGSQEVVIALVLCQLLAGLVSAQVLVAVGSMLADIADEHELRTGKRQEGVFFGAYAFANKATEGVGTAAGGLALQLIHWPTGADVKTALDIPPDVLFLLAMIAGPGLALGFLPGVWCFAHYRLDRERHARVLVELEARRKEEE